MSQSDDRYQAQRWFQTALEALTAARALPAAEIYPQACFFSQQAAEKALKAIWRFTDADPWGHSVKRLLLDFPHSDNINDFESLLEKATLLDKYYIPTRYPNGLPDLTPGQMYSKQDAEQGIEAANAVLEACRQWIERP